MVKQESQRRRRSAVLPSRLVKSLTVEQKQVGQTMVQLPQDRQRSAILSQCGLARLPSMISLALPGILRSMAAAALATALAAALRSASAAGREDSLPITSSPRF